MMDDSRSVLTWPRLRRMFVVLSALVLGFGVGLGVYVITGQQRTIQSQNTTLDRRIVTITYLQEENVWQRCLLREDVRYKVAFLGGVVALRGDPERADGLIRKANEQQKRYEDIDKICPPPAAPKDPGQPAPTSKPKGG